MAEQYDIGLIGLAVMGQNLVLNMADHGYQVAVYNRTAARVDDFCANRVNERPVTGFYSLAEFVQSLDRPRRVMLMIKSGNPVKQMVRQLVPLLAEGDIIIDGGNSYFLDTEQQIKELQKYGILYLGVGISGGEEGARNGPSIMPGGNDKAWPRVKPVLQAIAAKIGPNRDIPCCDWVGTGGAGHYVKMVHNGIEYGDMQLICEAYSLLNNGLGLNNDELYEVFAEWNRGELESYLIEITRDIFSVIDDKTGEPLVDKIMDRAGQKGTGRWTGRQALDLGVPTTLITEAVFARTLSALKDQRTRASRVLTGPEQQGEIENFRLTTDRACFIEQVRQALFAAKICSYAQGFFQLQAAAAEYGWDLDCSTIAGLWRGGCIIRAAFLEQISEAYKRDPDLENLLLDQYFREAVQKSQSGWRHVVCTAGSLGIAAPGIFAGLSYYDSYRSARLPHNLLQAQRDYFGAHTYERTDMKGVFHTDWGKLKRKSD